METVLARICFFFTVFTIVWKLAGSLPWIPGFESIWGTGRERNPAQYPRRAVSNELFWRIFYGTMYGGIGSIAQYCGLQISTDVTNRSSTDIMVGVFHTIIGIHHVVWWYHDGWGRLDFSQTRYEAYLPWCFLAGAVLTMYHGIRLLMCNTHTEFTQIIRRKTLVDMASIMTLIEVVVFMIENWFGVRDERVEEWAWIVTVAAPMLMFGLDFYSEMNKSEDTIKRKAS